MKLNFTTQTADLNISMSFKKMGTLEKVLNEAVELNGGDFDQVQEINEIATAFGLTITLPGDDSDEGKETSSPANHYE